MLSLTLALLIAVGLGYVCLVAGMDADDCDAEACD